jgi:hypothetical protein
MDARHRLVGAIHKVNATTGLAVTAMTTKKSDSDALANFPIRNIFAQGVDSSHNLMTRNPRESNAGNPSP